MDATVEIVEQEGETRTPTGKRLFLSIKGTREASSRDGVIPFRIDVRDLVYLLGHQLAALLVLVDVEARKAYWIDVHRYVRDRLNADNANWQEQESTTILFDEKNSEASFEREWPARASRGPLEISYLTMGIPRFSFLQDIDKEIATLEGLTKRRRDAARLKGELEFASAIELFRAGRFSDGDSSLDRAVVEARESGDLSSFVRAAEAKCSMLNVFGRAQNRQLFSLAIEAEAKAQQGGLIGEQLHLGALAAYAEAFRILRDWEEAEATERAGRTMDDLLIIDSGRRIIENNRKAFAGKVNALDIAVRGLLRQKSYVWVADLVSRIAVLLAFFSRSRTQGGHEALGLAMREASLKQLDLAGRIVSILGYEELKIHFLLDRAFILRLLVGLKEAMAAIDEADRLARGYLSGVLLPIVEEKRRILPRLLPY